MAGQAHKVDASRFAMSARSDVPRSAFDVQHIHKTTFMQGYLVPVYVDEVLPGDSFRMKMSAFIRLSTPIVPILDNLEFESFFFYVPNRLLWDNWARFMGEKADYNDTTAFLTPYANTVAADVPVASLPDYLGIPKPTGANVMKVSAFPMRAYNLIYNEWFRDQDLFPVLTVNTDDGPETGWASAGYSLQMRAKRPDYFTTARPWPAKPHTIAQIPQATSFNNQTYNQGFPAFTTGLFAGEGIGVPVMGIGVGSAAVTAGASTVRMTGGRVGVYGDVYNAVSQIRAIGTNMSPDIRVLVSDIRTSMLVQHMLELNSRGGTRYGELIRSHFGVISPDARLQRPEYLGGGRTMIQVNPVAQTSASGVAGTTTKLGELAAIGSAMVHDHGFSQSFTEHGIILGIVNVRSYLTYQQGLNRMWSRRTQFDFYWPGLANLSEQAILSQEIYATGDPALAEDVSVFGYQERWAEYKYKPSRTSGYFRSTVATPLDMWHLGQKFAARPVLNQAFLVDDAPLNRVLQVATNFDQELLADFLFDCRMVRPMPMYSIPGLAARL